MIRKKTTKTDEVIFTFILILIFVLIPAGILLSGLL